MGERSPRYWRCLVDVQVWFGFTINSSLRCTLYFFYSDHFFVHPARDRSLLTLMLPYVFTMLLPILYLLNALLLWVVFNNLTGWENRWGT